MSISTWQAQFNALMRARCEPCRGAGELDNALIGSVLFSTWTCPSCGGSGRTTQPVEHMAASMPPGVPPLPEGM